VSGIGFGIVGCGGAASDLCRAVGQLPAARVAALHDRLEARALELASTHGGTPHGSLAALLDDPAVDAVYVGLPHHLLAPVAAEALAAGKHVLVEKPMGLDVEEIRSLGRLAAGAGLTLVPVFELRATALLQEARRLVQGGAIGSVESVRIRTVIDKPDAYWRSGPRGLVEDSWRSRRAEAGGGVVLMNSIHQLDAIRYVTGLSFASALAEVATLHAAGVEVEDAAAAALRLSNGALASLAASAHSAGAVDGERVELDGAAGRLDLPDPTGSGRRRLRLFLRRPWEDLPAGARVEIDVGETDAYLQLLQGFVSAVERGAEPPAGAEDAAAALATVLAIYESARTGRAVQVDATRSDAGTAAEAVEPAVIE
jgi:UDP-N-acetyl-2-amino-2-deoxyglucuronate dehydrogenase